MALNSVLDYISLNVPCDNVRVEVYHIKDEATNLTKADPYVKTVYTTKKFRWKTLSNDPVTGKRAQIMQWNSPNPVERREPFAVKIALAL